MKLNKLFVSALAALAFVACSKDGEPGAEGPDNGQGMSVTISLKTSGSEAVQATGKGTRAEVDNFGSTAIILKTIKVFFADGMNGNILEFREFTSDQVKNRTAVFHSINPSATHAIVAANYGTLLNDTPATVADLENIQLQLTSYQVLADVPLMSEVGSLVPNELEHPEVEGETDVTWCKVELTVAPVLARIEIGGNLKITTSTEADEKFVYKDFTPKYVGLNGLYKECTLAGKPATSAECIYTNSNAVGFPVLSTVGDVTATPQWMYNEFPEIDQQNMIKVDDNVIDLSKVYAYNVMPGDEPEITLQFESTPISPDELGDSAIVPVSPKAYIKIVNFSKEGATDKLEAGKIYKIDGISFPQDKITMLDNQVLCVEVIVKVLDWTVETVTPEFGK